jgi:hypothetical protein
MMTTAPLVAFTVAFSTVMDAPDHFICGALTRHWTRRMFPKAKIVGTARLAPFGRSAQVRHPRCGVAYPLRQNPPPKPRRSLLSPLLHQLQMTIPTEFELPEDIRGFFKDGRSSR